MNHSDEQKILTVSELTQQIKVQLETTFPFVCIEGEISNFKEQTSGHLYFSLKDAQAQIAAVMFRGNAAVLKRMPKSGDHVIVKGELNIYPQKGNYQLVIRELTFAGLGELLLKLDELKRKLHKMGWFSKEHKKPLPHLPKRIGVVTSPTGAVIQDIVNVLTRRFSGFHLILNPVKVQGEGAAQEIAAAIEQFNRYKLVDVMIVGRGGGSLEDLWAFNEEIVASAIYYSQIPVICAVGHETDHCIAEYVADVRAPTPSAAAEMVMAEKAMQIKHLKQVESRIFQSLNHQIRQGKNHLNGFLRHPFFNNPYTTLGGHIQRIDNFREDLDISIGHFFKAKHQKLNSLQKHAQALKPTNQITQMRQNLLQLEKALLISINKKIQFWKQKLDYLLQAEISLMMKKKDYLKKLLNAPQKRSQLDYHWQRTVQLHHAKLNKLATTLKAIDPKNLLKRGYTILFSEKDHSVINSIHTLKAQDTVTLLLCDGEARAKITELIPDTTHQSS